MALFLRVHSYLNMYDNFHCEILKDIYYYRHNARINLLLFILKYSLIFKGLK